VFSQIASMLPKHIHAVTLNGFMLKVSTFVIDITPDKAFIYQLRLNIWIENKHQRCYPLPS
jgi:hypothetical protein